MFDLKAIVEKKISKRSVYSADEMTKAVRVYAQNYREYMDRRADFDDDGRSSVWMGDRFREAGFSDYVQIMVEAEDVFDRIFNTIFGE
jgi:hypothetical protein